MASMNSKSFQSTTAPDARQPVLGEPPRSSAARVAPTRLLVNFASKLRNAAAVTLDAAMGRYDR